jgi:hypothetical protein
VTEQKKHINILVTEECVERLRKSGGVETIEGSEVVVHVRYLANDPGPGIGLRGTGCYLEENGS